MPVSPGMCVDICVHDKNDGNPHAHITLTMRPFNEDKTWGDKQRKEYVFDKDGGQRTSNEEANTSNEVSASSSVNWNLAFTSSSK
jgi:hypothetical protein